LAQIFKDIGKVSTEEPFKKMVNQGMIQGVSRFVYRLETGLFSSATSKEQEKIMIIIILIYYLKYMLVKKY
jgi:leucyl-tRNA synthetase